MLIMSLLNMSEFYTNLRSVIIASKDTLATLNIQIQIQTFLDEWI